MNPYHDQAYLLHSQYKNAMNFMARVQLHRRFSVSKYGWSHWVFDHFEFDEGCRLLEVGCGPGLLWSDNQHRIPASWQITLTDFSPGMLSVARERLGEEGFIYEVADAQALPFADARFDAVIANHMLYHVPDLPRALAEIRRVLKPGGRFYASTIGREHMHELDELIWKCWPDSSWKGLGNSAPFVLENGQEALTPFFTQIVLHPCEDTLEVTEAEPLADYAFSSKLGSLLSNQDRAAFLALVRQELVERGTIQITNASGMFEARKA